MKHVVTAPLVIVHDQDGVAHHRYEGQVIQWLNDEQREHLLGLGLVEELHEPAPPGVIPADEAAVATPSAASAPEGKPERPTQVSTKEVWVDYAVRALGVDQATADAMTKNDLIALPAQ